MTKVMTIKCKADLTYTMPVVGPVYDIELVPSQLKKTLYMFDEVELSDMQVEVKEQESLPQLTREEILRAAKMCTAKVSTDFDPCLQCPLSNTGNCVDELINILTSKFLENEK